MEAKASVRLDKWLWAARFFKTRSLAADACGIGRIEVNGARAKASRDVRAGDRLVIRNAQQEFDVQVQAVSAVRGPAPAAQALYLESPESVARRQALAEERKRMHAAGDLPEGRPTKRDRRVISKWRSGIHRF